MAVFYHPESESTHLYYKDANADVVGFQAMHLGPDQNTSFNIRVYATTAPLGHDRNVQAVADGGDV